MLTIKKLSNPPDPEAPYLVRLGQYLTITPFGKPEDDPLNALNYYCDKAHLKHFVREILNVFQDEIPIFVRQTIFKAVDSGEPMTLLGSKRRLTQRRRLSDY